MGLELVWTSFGAKTTSKLELDSTLANISAIHRASRTMSTTETIEAIPEEWKVAIDELISLYVQDPEGVVLSASAIKRALSSCENFEKPLFKRNKQLIISYVTEQCISQLANEGDEMQIDDINFTQTQPPMSQSQTQPETEDTPMEEEEAAVPMQVDDEGETESTAELLQRVRREATTWLKGADLKNLKIGEAFKQFCAECNVSRDQRRQHKQEIKGVLKEIALSMVSQRASAPRIPVDEFSGLVHSHDVYKDFSTMLNQTDVSYGERGHNKFYLIQLLVPKGNSMTYCLFTKYGRVAAKNPQSQTQEFSTLGQAVAAFEKKFRDKTSNHWSERDSFVRKSGKYWMVDVQNHDDAEESDEPEEEGEEPQPLISVKLQHFIEMIFSEKAMQSALASLHIDANRLPLGKLSSTQIAEGFSVLDKISQALGTEQVDRQRLIDLSNAFFTLIPHDFGMTKPPVIASQDMIKEKLEMLEALDNMDTAYKYLTLNRGNRLEQKRLHRLDRYYGSLGTVLKAVEPDTDIFQTISHMVTSTHAATHNTYKLQVADIFKVDRIGERHRFKPFQRIPNHKLLWHGSRNINLVGILSKGLQVAPPQAPKTGYMFGKGIYFANCASKSANYIRATKERPYGTLLLCQVALGSQYELTKAEYLDRANPPHFSAWGKGKTTVAEEKAAPEMSVDGTTAMAGSGLRDSGVDDTSLLYDEFIVYDVSQVVCRYIVRVNFEFV